jgi:trimethylamine corrinoid protein
MLSELVMIAECLKAAVAVIRPELEKSITKVEVPGKVVIGTVEGDVHDIGKSLVASMLESSGYTVTDLGFDIPAKTFVMQTKFKKADISLCLISSIHPVPFHAMVAITQS